MQTEPNEIGHQRDQLEAERREIADHRHRDPIIAAAITRVAMVVVSLLPLLICWLLLSQKIEPAYEQQMTELLVEDLVSTVPRLVPPAKTDPPNPQLPEAFQNTFAVQPPFDINTKALSGIFIEHGQHPEGPTIVRATMQKS